MNRAFTLLELIVVIAIIVILASILFPVVNRGGYDARRSSCQSNQKQIALAFLVYAQDYDDRLPPVTSSSAGWASLVRPYAKSWWLWDCPSTPTNSGATTDYFFNGRLARYPTSRIVLPNKTLLLGEGDDGCRASAELRSFPLAALRNKKSPAWRHREGANYAFTDGHVKWFKPEDLESHIKWNPRHIAP